MSKQVVYALVLVSLLIGVVGLLLTVPRVGAAGTIYIRPDGNIDPPTSPLHREGSLYVFVGNISDSIVVERDDIILDGDTYTLHGAGVDESIGVDLTDRTNVTIRNMTIERFCFGIHLGSARNTTIVGNTITANNQMPIHDTQEAGHGLQLVNSTQITITGNVIRDNWYGIRLDGTSHNNLIRNNHFANNDEGIQLYQSAHNTFSDNTFVNDGLTVFDSYENVVESSWVNGKPLVYLEGVSDRLVEEAGQVILVNCSQIRVRQLTLTNTTTAVQVLRTDRAEISENNITANSDVGIRLDGASHHNRIHANYIADNDEGIQLYQSAHNTISENVIVANTWDGIQLYESTNNSLSDNQVHTNGQSGVRLYWSSNNSVCGNQITAHTLDGVFVRYSPHNSIWGNQITANWRAISLIYSVNNRIYHNNCIDNTLRAYSSTSGNTWDDGYPTGGNYWSDYTGADRFSGASQNETGSDGLGDAHYTLDLDNRDTYPLMSPIRFFDAGIWNNTSYRVSAASNSTVVDFHFNASEGALLKFVVEGENATKGACRVGIPNDLVWTENGWSVTVNGTPVAYTATSDTSCTYLWFSYDHSTKTLIVEGTNVIPEFSPLIIPQLFMIATALAVIIQQIKRGTTRETS